jgi:hypothetical protein
LLTRSYVSGFRASSARCRQIGKRLFLESVTGEHDLDLAAIGAVLFDEIQLLGGELDRDRNDRFLPAALEGGRR